MHIRILDRLFGGSRATGPQRRSAPNAAAAYAADCYRYLLRTAPPVAIERAHMEALRQLTATQRHQLLRHVCRHLCPDALQPFDPEPRALARLLTCAELRQSGILERVLEAESSLPLFWALTRAFTSVPIAQQFLGGIDYDGAATDPRDTWSTSTSSTTKAQATSRRRWSPSSEEAASRSNGVSAVLRGQTCPRFPGHCDA